VQSGTRRVGVFAPLLYFCVIVIISMMKSTDSASNSGVKPDFTTNARASSKSSKSSSIASKVAIEAKKEMENIRTIVQQEASKVLLSDQAKKLAQQKGLVVPAPEKISKGKFEDIKHNKNNLKSITKSKFNPHRKIEKPAIFFIRGLELFGNDGGGMKEMSDNVTDGKYYSWQQQDKMITEIMKRPAHQPVILIGHGMGSDTAVEISNELNSASHGFKKIDLLVTLDSIGFNNDIIPQNVAKNINYITDGSSFLSDAPNIARKTEETEVINHLSSEDHGDLIESSDVQFKIFDSINTALIEKTLKKVDLELINH
jgi:hypothetical protein